jgi:hypothetical protein
MPQTSYTNADLKRFERKKLGVSVEPNFTNTVDVPDYDPSQEVNVDDLMAQAKATLGRANKFTRERDDLRGKSDEAAALERSRRTPSVMDSAAERLAKLGRDVKARNAYAMSQPAEQALGGLAEGFAAVGIPELYWPARGGSNIIEGGVERVFEEPLATAFDASMLAAPALRALKGVAKMTGAAGKTPKSGLSFGSLSPEAQARNIEAENMVGNPGFSRGAAGKVSGIPGAGRSREIPTRANESTFGGRVRPEYGDVSKNDILNQKAKLSKLSTLPSNRPVGLQTFDSSADPRFVEQFAQGPVIERGAGAGPIDPRFYSGQERGAPAFEQLRQRANSSSSLGALLAEIQKYSTR